MGILTHQSPLVFLLPAPAPKKLTENTTHTQSKGEMSVFILVGLSFKGLSLLFNLIRLRYP